MAKEETGLKLPIIDLSSFDKISTASDLRQACMEYGFFYLINHGVEEEFLKRVFDESMKFFSLPIKEKMKVARKDNRGYTPLYAEKLDSSSSYKGDSKENFDVCPIESISSQSYLNQWPSEEVLPFWRVTMESYSERILSAGKRLMSLIALALNLDEDFFEEVGAFSPPTPFLRLLHYPGKLGFPDEDIYGASPHSDYGMITLLATDGVSGLQVCRDKFKQPMVWEDVPHINGALVVNIGDMTERWTNCLFQSTLHRVIPTGLERYSIALFLDPNPDCLVECLKVAAANRLLLGFPQCAVETTLKRGSGLRTAHK